MRYLTLLFLSGLLAFQPLQALEAGGLYETEVEVAKEDEASRIKAMRQAMLEVLTKASGSSEVGENSALQKAVQDPSRYVQQYRYQNSPGVGQDGKASLLLHVGFDRRSIDGLLRDNGFKQWGSTRPSTLIWLGVEDNGNRVLVGDEDGGLVRERITKEARRRALPVQLPKLDRTDTKRVTTADVWGEFLDVIREASQRYGAQAILVGRLYPHSSRRWEARWVLEYNGKVSRWDSRSGDVTALITEVIDRVTDKLAQNFVRSETVGGNAMLMKVEGVGNLGDYRRVLDYLRKVQGVRDVTTETMMADAVLFRLELDGGRSVVLQAIALDDILEQIRQPLRPEPKRHIRQPPSYRELPPGAARPAQPVVSRPATGAAVAAEAPVVPDIVYRLLP